MIFKGNIHYTSLHLNLFRFPLKAPLIMFIPSDLFFSTSTINYCYWKCFMLYDLSPLNLTRLKYIEWWRHANLLLMCRPCTPLSKFNQYVTVLGEGGISESRFFCYLKDLYDVCGPLFIKVECQIKNGTLKLLTILILFSWQ